MSGMGGDDYTQSNCRNGNRICLTVACVLFLEAFVGIPLYFYLRKNQSVPNPCHEHLSIPLLKPIFHPDGSVSDGNDTYPSGYHFPLNGRVRGCLCVLKPCIRKCCAKDEYYAGKTSKSGSRCQKSLGVSPFENLSLPVHRSAGERVKVDRDHFRILYGDVCQHGKFVLDAESFPQDEHELNVDGTVQNVNWDDGLDVSMYCMDSVKENGEIRVFVCFPDPAVDIETEIQLQLYPIAMIVSMPFLLATIVIYSTLPRLRNLHGKSLACQCTCLLGAYVSFAVVQFRSDKLNNFWCIFISFVAQFMFLGSFFWLNVISFDIWWAFSGLRPAKWGLKAMEQKKFLLYSLYAWGMPVGIVAITVGMDLMPGIPDSIRPGIGQLRCWFRDKIGQFLYFYLPSGIVLVLNTVMFVKTSFKLQSLTRNKRDKIRFCQFLRLFIVMGLNWILELVSFFVGGPKSLWFITDLANSLQGVAIFFFFVCKRNVLQDLNKILCPSLDLFRGNDPECSKSLSTSISKTEIDVLALKSQGDGNESKHEDT